MIGPRPCCRVVMMSVLILAPRVAHPQADVVGVYPIRMEHSGSQCGYPHRTVTSGTFEVRSVSGSSLVMSLNGAEPGEVWYNPQTGRVEHDFPGPVRLRGNFTRTGNTLTFSAGLHWVNVDCVVDFVGSIQVQDRSSSEGAGTGGEVAPQENQSVVPQEGTQGGETSGGGGSETTTESGNAVDPGPTVIGGKGTTAGDGSRDPPSPPPDSDDGNGGLFAALVGAVLVGAAVVAGRNGKSGGKKTPSARRVTTKAASRPLDGKPFEDEPEIPKDPYGAFKLGPAKTLREPVAPADDDPIARAKEKAKRAADAAKKSMPKEKKDGRKKETEIGEVATPELSKLKKELKEWEDSKKSSASKPPQSKPTKGEKTELERLKEEQKRAQEEADRKILDDMDNDLREIEERHKREEEENKRWMEAEKKRELARQQAEKERQEKEAEERRKEAERAAAEEAELKRRREERARARREAEAKEEAEEAAREAAEAEAARKAAQAEAEKKKAAEKKETESEKEERERREFDDFYRQEAIEKAREADAKDRQRLKELGFTPKDIAEYRRNLGMMEAGTYERSGNRMGTVEFAAEWVSYVGDKSVDLLSSLTGTAGSRVKDLYVGGKYFLGSAVGDMLPGGEGVTTGRVAKGASDAVIEVGVSKVWDKFLETGGLKWSKMAEGYDISSATSYWPKAFGAGRFWSNEIRAKAYVEAMKGLAEGTAWDIITVDRWKNLFKGDPVETAANAFEKYILRFPGN